MDSRPEECAAASQEALAVCAEPPARYPRPPAMPGSKRQPRVRAGLKQIAEELNVSVSLVSKVLNGRLGTSGAAPEKIDAIKTKAAQIGYQKNLLARALRTGRQDAIAVYVHRHGLPGTAIVDEMMMGIAEEATRLHQRLVIHYYETPEEFHAFMPRVHANAVDGVIIGGLPHRELVSELLDMQAQGLPVVTILDEPLSREFPNIGMDQKEITRRSTLHLIDRGCRRIAHFHARFRQETPQSDDRCAGYRNALAERGLPIDPKLIVNVHDYVFQEGERAAQRLLDEKIDFDGIVGQTDQHAAGALNLLIRNGKRVPRDVKIIGIDNAPFCEFTYVPLSSVSQEFKMRGTESVRKLMQALDGKPVTSLKVEPVVFQRASSGV